jgi:hypothetical protein
VLQSFVITNDEVEYLYLRRLIPLLILCAALAILVMLDRAASSWTPVISGAPGALLYAASFDGGATEGFNDEWDQYTGRLAASIEDSALIFRIDEPRGAPFSAPSAFYMDFDARTAGRAVAGDNSNNGFGIIFRLRDPDNHYRFLISSDGYYRVVRTLNGDQKDLSTWIPSDAIQQGIGVTNRLRVIGRGSQFQFFINDQRVQLCIPDDPSGISTYSGGQCFGTMRDSLEDGALDAGAVGLTAESLDLPGEVRIAFDYLLIYSPDET